MTDWLEWKRSVARLKRCGFYENNTTDTPIRSRRETNILQMLRMVDQRLASAGVAASVFAAMRKPVFDRVVVWRDAVHTAMIRCVASIFALRHSHSHNNACHALIEFLSIEGSSRTLPRLKARDGKHHLATIGISWVSSSVSDQTDIVWAKRDATASCDRAHWSHWAWASTTLNQSIERLPPKLAKLNNSHRRIC